MNIKGDKSFNQGGGIFQILKLFRITNSYNKHIMSVMLYIIQ
jgi:hypothetical protein